MQPEAVTPRDRALSSDQWVVLLALAGMAALCWWWLIFSGQHVHGSPLESATVVGLAGMGSGVPTGPYLISAFVMWTLMMIAMMVPSALPMILHFTRFSTEFSPRTAIQISLVFAGSYLLVWVAFSAFAAAFQTWLVMDGFVGRMGLAFGSDKFAAFLLIMAALYQLSPIKRVCLDQCRSPASFHMLRWRPGLANAVRFGLAHGVHCLGCCWLLTLLLFIGGVMNLAWVALLALVVILEKQASPSFHIEKWLAGVMAVGGLVLAFL